MESRTHGSQKPKYAGQSFIFGIPEVKGETPSDCVEKVHDLIENKMNIENAKKSITLQRAHRIGK
jgi:hypothetical protein